MAKDAEKHKETDPSKSLRRILGSRLARVFIPNDAIDFWLGFVVRHFESSNSPVVDSKPGNGFEGVDDLVNRRELQLAIAFGDKAESWLWLSVALLLRLDPLKRRFGLKPPPSLGWQSLNKVHQEYEKHAIGLGRAVSAIHKDLLRGVSPQDVVIEVGAESLPSWTVPALQFALTYLSPPKPQEKPQVQRSPQRSVPREKIDLDLEGFAISAYRQRDNRPDLPPEDLFEARGVVWNPQGTDDDSDDEPNPVQANTLQNLHLEEWWALRENEIHAAGALIQGVDRTLLPGEGIAALELLISMVDDVTESLAFRIAALSFVISALTAWSHQAALARLIARLKADPTQFDDLPLNSQGFLVDVPEAKKFAKPKDHHRTGLRSTRTTFRFPVSPWVNNAVESLAAAQRGRSESLQFDRSFYCDQVRRRLREKLSKISDERIRTLLPCAVWMQSGDVVLTQIVTGQLLDHTSAPLHYMAYRRGEVYRAYDAALARSFPQLLRITEQIAAFPEDDHWIGAPTAAIDDAYMHQAVQASAMRVDGRIRSGQLLKERIEAYNDLVFYTARMFAVATAHRLTFHFGLIRCTDLLLDIQVPGRDSDSSKNEPGVVSCGFAILADKMTDGGSEYRLAVLPAMLVEQLKVMRSALRRLVKVIPPDVKGRSLVAQLQQVLDGRRSLFSIPEVRFHADSIQSFRVIRVNRKRLQASWPELILPVESLRKRFANRARDTGMGPVDIRRQMGHTMDYVPFGPADPDSPFSLASRIAGKLENLLSADGWTVTTGMGDSAVPWVRETHDTLFSLEAAHQGYVQHRNKRAKQWLDQVKRCAGHNEEKLKEVFAEHIGRGALEDSKPGSLLPNSDDDFRNLAERIRRDCPDPSLFPAITLKLRKWGAQQQRDHRLSLSRLPRVAFFAASNERVMVPTVIRAYLLCGKFLGWAERQNKDERFTEDGVLSDRFVAAMTIEFAIRDGLCCANRLLAAFKGLNEARRFGKRLDCAVIPLALQAGQKPKGGNSTAFPTDIRPIQEGFVMSGLSAVTALVAQKEKITWPELDEARLEAILRAELPENLVGSAKAPLLQTLLKVASTGRRLTQSGIRVSWETSALKCGSIALAREAVIRTGQWRKPEGTLEVAKGEGGSIKSAAPRLGHQNDTDAKYLRELRALVGSRKSRQKVDGGKQIEQIGTRRSPKKLSRPELISAVARLGERSAHNRGTSLAFTAMVLTLLGDKSGAGIRPISVYTYLCALIESLIVTLNGRNLLDLDGDELDKIFQVVIYTKSPRNRKSTVIAVRHLMRAVVSLGGSGLDEESTIYQEWIDEATHGYLLTTQEIARAGSMIEGWRRRAASEWGGNTSAGPSEVVLVQANHRRMCALKMGIRSKEISLLDRQSLSEAGGSIHLQVKSVYDLQLKAKASKRSLNVPFYLNAQEIEDFEAQMELRGVRLNSKAEKPKLDKLHKSLDQETQNDAAKVLSHVLRQVAPSDSARPHGGRHTMGSSGMVQIAKIGTGICFEDYEGLKLSSGLREYEHLDPGLQMIALSRILGHGTPTTTLSYYVHLLSYCTNTDIGWPAPKVEAICYFAFVKSVRAFRTGLSRATKAHGDMELLARSVLVLKLNREENVADPVNDEQENESVSASFPVPGRKLSLLWVGEALYHMAKGTPLDMIAIQMDCPLALPKILREELEALQDQYRFHLIDFSNEGKGNRMGRMPRLSSQSYLKRADQMRNERPKVWSDFLKAVMRQTKLDGQFYVAYPELADAVRTVFKEVIEQESEFIVDRDTGKFIVQSAQAAPPIREDQEAIGVVRSAARFLEIVSLLVSRVEEIDLAGESTF